MSTTSSHNHMEPGTIIPASLLMLPSAALETEPIQQQPLDFGADISQSPPRHSRQYTTPEWQSKRSIIKHLYIELNKPLKQVMSIMSREHNFHATYVTRNSLSKHVRAQANVLKGEKCTLPISTIGGLQRIIPRKE